LKLSIHPFVRPVIHAWHGGDNHVAIDLIVQHIRTKLGQHDFRKIYPNVYVIQSTLLENLPQGLQIGLPNLMVSFFQPWGQYKAVKTNGDFFFVFSGPSLA